jgi:hypothetical protein
VRGDANNENQDEGESWKRSLGRLNAGEASGEWHVFEFNERRKAMKTKTNVKAGSAVWGS